MSGFELAQLNIGRTVAPLDDPVMHGFMSNLAEINGLGEASRGFVWRLADDSGVGATAIRAYDDPLMIVNLTVWTGIDELYAFAYRTRHVEFLRARRDWFEPLDQPSLVLWWVPADHRPSVQEARARLDHLTAHGPTAYAFTFKVRFGPDGAVLSPGSTATSMSGAPP